MPNNKILIIEKDTPYSAMILAESSKEDFAWVVYAARKYALHFDPKNNEQKEFQEKVLEFCDKYQKGALRCLNS